MRAIGLTPRATNSTLSPRSAASDSSELSRGPPPDSPSAIGFTEATSNRSGEAVALRRPANTTSADGRYVDNRAHESTVYFTVNPLLGSTLITGITRKHGAI